MEIIAPIFLLLASIVLIYYGYKLIFETDIMIQKHIEKRRIKENSFNYNWLKQNSNKLGTKITGYLFIVGGIIFFICFILAILRLVEKLCPA